MAIKLISSDHLPLTPELAKEFKDMPHTDTERPLDKKHVEKLKNKAIAGHLINFNWAKAKLNGKEYRVNGQHSSTMLCDLPPRFFPAGLNVNLDTYEVDKEEDLVILFAQFDDPASKRSTGDLAGVNQMQHEELKNVPRASVMLALDGYAWWMLREHKAKQPPKNSEARYRLLHDDHIRSFCEWFGKLYSEKTPEFKPTSVIAAMYGTFNSNENVAREFWTDVSKQDGEWPGALSKWLLDQLNEKHTVDGLHQGCREAWNAYRRDEPLRQIKATVIRKRFHTLVS
jgi:hypothetical protein